MITLKKYAAIDIGSNAMRLLVTNIVEQKGQPTQFNKSSLVRVPIRLGQDAFTVGEISDENVSRMVDAMKAFNLLMKDMLFRICFVLVSICFSNSSFITLELLYAN